MVTYLIRHHDKYNLHVPILENMDPEYRRRLEESGWVFEEVTTDEVFIRLWTVVNDLGDGTANTKIFPTQEEAENFANNNEYFPEVNDVIIDITKFTKVGKYD